MQVSRITLRFQDYIAGSMLVPIIETGNMGKSPDLSRKTTSTDAELETPLR